MAVVGRMTDGQGGRGLAAPRRETVSSRSRGEGVVLRGVQEWLVMVEAMVDAMVEAMAEGVEDDLVWDGGKRKTTEHVTIVGRNYCKIPGKNNVPWWQTAATTVTSKERVNPTPQAKTQEQVNHRKTNKNVSMPVASVVKWLPSNTTCVGP